MSGMGLRIQWWKKQALYPLRANSSVSQSDKHAIPGQYDRCCEQREHGIVGASQPLKISGPETGCHQFTKN